MSNFDLIKKTITHILRYAPAYGGAFGFAQQATDTANNVKSVMPDFPVKEKVEEITKNQEYARSLVQLAAIESAYNTARGMLHVTIYGILVWGLYRLVQAMMAIANHEEKGK